MSPTPSGDQQPYPDLHALTEHDLERFYRGKGWRLDPDDPRYARYRRRDGSWADDIRGRGSDGSAILRLVYYGNYPLFEEASDPEDPRPSRFMAMASGLVVSAFLAVLPFMLIKDVVLSGSGESDPVSLLILGVLLLLLLGTVVVNWNAYNDGAFQRYLLKRAVLKHPILSRIPREVPLPDELLPDARAVGSRRRQE